MLTAVRAGYVIIHAIQRHRFHFALVVVGVLHGIVTALDLGYRIQRAKLRCAVFLARVGAVKEKTPHLFPSAEKRNLPI